MCVLVCVYSGMIIDITHLSDPLLLTSISWCHLLCYVKSYAAYKIILKKKRAALTNMYTKAHAATEKEEKKEGRNGERAGMNDRYGTMSWIFFFISRDIFYMLSESVYSPLTDSYFSAECITLNCTSPCYLAFDEGKRNTQSECERIYMKISWRTLRFFLTREKRIKP